MAEAGQGQHSGGAAGLSVEEPAAVCPTRPEPCMSSPVASAKARHRRHAHSDEHASLHSTREGRGVLAGTRNAAREDAPSGGLFAHEGRVGAGVFTRNAEPHLPTALPHNHLTSHHPSLFFVNLFLYSLLYCLLLLPCTH